MRNITRHLIQIIPGMNVPVRAYESIRVVEVSDRKPPETKHVFRRTEDILADDAGRADLLAQAVRDAIAFRRRYAALSELSQLIEVIDDTISGLG